MTAMAAKLRRFDLRDYGIVYAFVALFVALSFASGSFLKFQNSSNILDQWAAIGLLACGETLCIIAGVFDLSVGANVSVSGVVACKVANSTSPTLGLIAGVATGLGLGIVERDRDRPHADQLVHRHARDEHRLRRARDPDHRGPHRQTVLNPQLRAARPGLAVQDHLSGLVSGSASR